MWQGNVLFTKIFIIICQKDQFTQYHYLEYFPIIIWSILCLRRFQMIYLSLSVYACICHNFWTNKVTCSNVLVLTGFLHQLRVKQINKRQTCCVANAVANGYIDQKVFDLGSSDQAIQSHHRYRSRIVQKERFASLIYFWFDQVTN